MTDDLIARLRSHALDCIRAADIDTDAVLMPNQLDDIADTMTESADALEAARESTCVSLLADIRWACGDKGALGVWMVWTDKEERSG